MTASVSPEVIETPYLIRKSGMFYAVNSCGYVSSPLLAELFTKEKAMSEQECTHGDCQAVPITEMGITVEQIDRHIDRLNAIRDCISVNQQPSRQE
jgi:hypothetical protein